MCVCDSGGEGGTVGRAAPRASIHEHLCTVDSDVVTVREMLYCTVQYTQISPFIRNGTRMDMISSMLPDHNCMGIP